MIAKSIITKTINYVVIGSKNIYLKSKTSTYIFRNITISKKINLKSKFEVI